MAFIALACWSMIIVAAGHGAAPAGLLLVMFLLAPFDGREFDRSPEVIFGSVVLMAFLLAYVVLPFVRWPRVFATLAAVLFSLLAVLWVYLLRGNEMLESFLAFSVPFLVAMVVWAVVWVKYAQAIRLLPTPRLRIWDYARAPWGRRSLWLGYGAIVLLYATAILIRDADKHFYELVNPFHLILTGGGFFWATIPVGLLQAVPALSRYYGAMVKLNLLLLGCTWLTEMTSPDQTLLAIGLSLPFLVSVGIWMHAVWREKRQQV